MFNYQLNKDFMYRNILIVLFIFILSVPGMIYGQSKPEILMQSQTSFVYQKLSTINPSPEAEALYRYLQNIFGEKILSGQMSTEGGINEIEYIEDATIKKPVICGFDLENENANNKEIQNAINWWKAGGIPLIMWHWGAPSVGEGFGNSKKEISIEKCFQEGTPEYTAFWKELKTKADHLETLRDAHVPVIWSPFHEQNGSLFWWGKQGPQQFIKLWQTMFNYFTKERNLNNLIWVTSFSEDIDSEWFPGKEYVDVIAASSYKTDPDPHKDLFDKARIIANNNVTPLAYNECAAIPNPDDCRNNDAMWSWWMLRPDNYLTNTSKDYLNSVYYNDLIVTLKEVPDIAKDFSKETVKRSYSSATTIPFDEFKTFNLGKKIGKLSISNDQLEIEAKGKGIQGAKDDCFFAFKQIEGDFDISVQVLGLSPADIYSMAGIMAREDLTKKSPQVFFQVFPDNRQKDKNAGGLELKYRTEKSKETMVIYPDPQNAGDKYNVDYPNTWIRLKRRGNIFKSYISHDHDNWYIYSVHSQKMPEKLLVGLAVASHNDQTATKAEFGNLEIIWE